MNISKVERRRSILELVSQSTITVSDLVGEFGVSEMTIRRDLDALENQGKLLRVHGGAIAREQLAYELSFKEKEGKNSAAKKAIGEAAAALVSPTDVVFIDTGSTALAVARAVRRQSARVVVTCNMAAALEFVGSKDIRILVTGGELSSNSPDLYGEWALQVLSTISVDIAFFGCDAVDPASGVYAADTRSAAVTRTVLARAQASYLVADSSKFGKRAMCMIAEPRTLTGAITDTALPDKYRKELEEERVRVIIAQQHPCGDA